jgi:bacterial leucyl aminopeptidase
MGGLMILLNRFLVSVAMTASLTGAVFAHDRHHADEFEIPNAPPATIISDLSLLRALNIDVVAAKENVNLGVAIVSADQRNAISAASHARGACAGYKKILLRQSFGPAGYEALLAPIEKQILKNNRARAFNEVGALTLVERPEITKTAARVSEARIRSQIEWFSSFHNRYHSNPTANEHANQLKAQLEGMLSKTKLNYKVELINHTSTPQKSLRVRLEGSQRPSEVVVIGGHYDSIMVEGIFSRPNPKGRAPGADDNASGSTAIIEALTLVAENGVQPQRTVDFIWYAAEEVGLYGSQEIAASYKRQNVDVISVMQLDMTLFPGNGELIITQMTDFTSPWLRNVFLELNRLYIGATVKNSKCGYGCSDHASWHDEGYPTVMPSEADLNNMNENIHSDSDLIDSRSNFKHSAAFAKGAVAYVMEMGNNTLRETK